MMAADAPTAPSPADVRPAPIPDAFLAAESIAALVWSVAFTTISSALCSTPTASPLLDVVHVLGLCGAERGEVDGHVVGLVEPRARFGKTRHVLTCGIERDHPRDLGMLLERISRRRRRRQLQQEQHQPPGLARFHQSVWPTPRPLP